MVVHGGATWLRVYRVGMGMLGEMFPGKKLRDEGGEDGEGELHRPRFDIDLDSGVVRMPTLGARRTEHEPAKNPAEDGD